MRHDIYQTNKMQSTQAAGGGWTTERGGLVVLKNHSFRNLYACSVSYASFKNHYSVDYLHNLHLFHRPLVKWFVNACTSTLTS